MKNTDYGRAIGGYPELDFFRQDNSWLRDGIFLNSARNCLEYLCRVEDICHIHLPYYTCEVLLEPLKRRGITWSYYGLERDFTLGQGVPRLGEGERLVYTNYFGLMDNYIRQLDFKGLILDQSQALLAPVSDRFPSFYSPRKFIGMPDGGILLNSPRLDAELETETSWERMSHLLIRADVDAESGYADFRENDAAISRLSLKRMSHLSRKIWLNADMELLKVKRRENYMVLLENLRPVNELRLPDLIEQTPLCYPLLVSDDGLRKYLIDHSVYVPTFWPGLLELSEQLPSFEKELFTYLLPLPVDQRYSAEDMKNVVELIQDYLNG